MDLYRIIRELVHERQRVQRIIESLELMVHEQEAVRRTPAKRRGRKSMDEGARKEVSERMVRYWAQRRANKNTEAED
jgi:hypothetical protein